MRLEIGSAGWITVECSVWERVQWSIGALTLGDGRIEPFELLNLYWTTSTPWGGDWVDVVTLGDYVC